MDGATPNLVPIKDAVDQIGCSDKVIRNYIRDRKIAYQTIDSPYGEAYLVDPEEVRRVYNSRRSPTVEIKKELYSTGNTREESTALKEILPTLGKFQSDYKEAMEKIALMSYELGNAQKEVKLLTGNSMEKSALEKQLQALMAEKARLETQNAFLQETLETLKTQVGKLEETLENERKKGVFGKFFGR